MKKLVASFLLFSALPLAAAPLNSLYFGLDNMRGFAPVYWWFLSDGRVLEGLPTTGIAPSDFDTACKASPGSCGTYTLSGEKLVITMKGAQPQNWTYKALDGGFQMNYLIMTPVEKFPAGAKLNGNWDKPFSSSFGSRNAQISVTSPTFLSFKSDGTFSERNVAGVNSNNVDSMSKSATGGTYSLHDNVLMLVRNGKSERHMIFPVAGGNLNIDGQVYNKAK